MIQPSIRQLVIKGRVGGGGGGGGGGIVWKGVLAHEYVQSQYTGLRTTALDFVS